MRSVVQQTLQAINNDFPEIDVHSISFLGAGVDNVAVEINDHIVFRFPKTDYASKNLQKEISLLPHLAEYVNVAIPQFTYVGKPSNAFKKWYVGYEAIAGQPLTKECYRKLEGETQKELAKQLGEFVRRLHSFPLSSAEKCGVGLIDLREICRRDIKNIQERVFGSLPEDTRANIELLFDDYLDNEENFRYKQALLHGDLCEQHIYYDTAGKRLTGVIDFSDVCIGDPAFDLHFLFNDYGSQFFHLFLQSYGAVEHTTLKSKLRFFHYRRRIINLYRDASAIISLVKTMSDPATG